MLTKLSVNELLLHLTHEINFVQYFEPASWGNLSSYILASFTKLFCCYSMAVFKLTEDMD
jgi:hypothetical protein